jgi:hypothetical protein
MRLLVGLVAACLVIGTNSGQAATSEASTAAGTTSSDRQIVCGPRGCRTLRPGCKKTDTGLTGARRYRVVCSRR